MEREKRITRMNSLTNALKFWEIKIQLQGKKDITEEEVLRTAERFFKWSWGEEVNFNEEEIENLENPFD
jgi:hypothetical protein